MVIVYYFGGNLNLENIKKKFEPHYSDRNLLGIKIGKLEFIVFRNGYLRIVHESKDRNLLLKEVQARAVELNNFLNEIKKLSKAKDPKITEDRDFELEREISFEGEKIIREICNSNEIVGNYQKERIETLAGEKIGRKINASSKKELIEKITKEIKSLKIGIPKLESEKDTYFSIIVYQSLFSYGSKVKNEKLCNFIRGLIRGGICKFLNMENVNVIESKCFGVGDVYCKFDSYLI